MNPKINPYLIETNSDKTAQGIECISGDFKDSSQTSREPRELTDILNDQSGKIGASHVLAVGSAPVLGTVGYFVGSGLGWAVGNVMDKIPGVKSLIPLLADGTGLIYNWRFPGEINEHFYQALFAFAGILIGGVLVPYRLMKSVRY